MVLGSMQASARASKSSGEAPGLFTSHYTLCSCVLQCFEGSNSPAEHRKSQLLDLEP